MKETPWSRIKGQSSVDKEFLEIVGYGKPTGSVLKETITCFRHDINKRVKNDTAEIRLRVLSCNRMKEQRRKPEVPEERSPSGGTFRLPYKGYLKGTCTNSFCEKWHPPECLFYKTKSGCRCGEKCSTDTDAYDSGSTAGAVDVLCQPLSFGSGLYQNDISQFDQTVFSFQLVTLRWWIERGRLLSASLPQVHGKCSARENELWHGQAGYRRQHDTSQRFLHRS